MSVCDEYIFYTQIVTRILLNVYQSSKNTLILSVIKMEFFKDIGASTKNILPRLSVCDVYIFDTKTVKPIFLNMYQSPKNMLIL